VGLVAQGQGVGLTGVAGDEQLDGGIGSGTQRLTVEETVPDSGSPALSMTAAPLWLRTNEKLLENADRGAGWRPPIIEIAGEPRFRRT
jgi:hypothetical protein